MTHLPLNAPASACNIVLARSRQPYRAPASCNSPQASIQSEWTNNPFWRGVHLPASPQTRAIAAGAGKQTGGGGRGVCHRWAGERRLPPAVVGLTGVCGRAAFILPWPREFKEGKRSVPPAPELCMRVACWSIKSCMHVRVPLTACVYALSRASMWSHNCVCISSQLPLQPQGVQRAV